MQFERPSSPILKGPTPSAAPYKNRPDCWPDAAGSRARAQSQISNLKSEIPQQLNFEPLWAWPHNSPVLTPGDLAEKWNLSESQIRNLCDEGSLVSFHINAADQPHREHLRIHRATCQLGQQRTLSGLVEIWRSVPDWLLPHKKETLQVHDIAHALYISGEHVRILHEAGKLHGFSGSVSSASLKHLRFHRDDLIQFVRSRLALKNNLSVQDLQP